MVTGTTSDAAAGRSEATRRSALVFNPYDYQFHDDPYPIYLRLRDEAPLYHNDELNFWALSRHKDVLAGFRDNIRLSNANGVSLDPAAFGPEAHRVMSILALDHPRHLRLRTLISKGFTPRRIRELEPRVAELSNQHLDSAIANKEFDFIAEFAGKLPMDVISELVGVPEADRAEVRKLADDVMHREEGVTDVPPSAVQASASLMMYYIDLIKQYRANPAENLTTALLAAEVDGDRLADDEILAFMFLLVIAGNETTTKLLSNAVYWAWRYPDERAKPWGDPGLVPQWAEETLRFDTSSHILARTVTEDIPLYDRVVPAGDIMLLLPGSANRDERVFEAADEYRIGRNIGTSLLSFGSGVHFCLGAHLARLEARVALAQFVERVKDYEIDENNAVRVHSSNVRGYLTLPISVEVKE
jgi:cytochrome P450